MQYFAGEFEKELQQQEEAAARGENDVLNSDLSQDIATSDSDQSLSGPSFSSQPADGLDANSFIHQYMEKNYGMSLLCVVSVPNHPQATLDFSLFCELFCGHF